MEKKLLVLALFAVLLFGCIGGGGQQQRAKPTKPVVSEAPTLVAASPSPEATVEPSPTPTLEPSPSPEPSEEPDGGEGIGLDDLGVDYVDEGDAGGDLDEIGDYD